MWQLKKFEQAARLIHRHVPPTPMKVSQAFHNQYNTNVYLKLENLNLSGSFKIRGAIHALHNIAKSKAKVVFAASAGNHAQGVAYSARMHGINAVIYMPESTPMIKVRKTKLLGAEVVLIGDSFDDAKKAALEACEAEKGVFLHPFDNEDVIVGQGSIGIEIIEQVRNVGRVFVPIGGGGLISGIASVLKQKAPKCQIIGVQTKLYPSMDSTPISSDYTNLRTIADGIAVKKPGELTKPIVDELVDQIILIDEREIAAGIINLLEYEQVLAEGAGAVSYAAYTKAIEELGFPIIKGSDDVVIISGGNIDLRMVKRLTDIGLIASGRLMRLKATIIDRPGSLVGILEAISALKANVLDATHQRIFGSHDVANVDLTLDLETFDFQHQKKIRDILREKKINFTIDN